jgi:predicted DNA-binding transcriptional regulator YafY
LKHNVCMKVDRLMSILMLLLDRQKCTARELAEYFEVSIRTIQRDIDALCEAGIPIYADVGQQGGYQLTENYRMDRSFLTRSEMDTLVMMLKGFQETLLSSSIKSIMEKLSGIHGTNTAHSTFHIDMTPWGADSRFSHTLKQLGKAIEQSHLISFEYFDLYNRKSERNVEPYKILIKSGSWYLHAYCLLRKDYRLFRLSRIFSLETSDSKFRKRDDSEWQSSQNSLEISREQSEMTIRFSPEARGRIPDFFDPRTAVEEPDGSLVFKQRFPVDEWLITVLLGISDVAEVLEPASLRAEVQNRIKKSRILYEL